MFASPAQVFAANADNERGARSTYSSCGSVHKGLSMNSTLKDTTAHIPGRAVDASGQAAISPAELLAQIRDLKTQIFDLNALFEVSRQLHEVWDVDALLDGILLVAIEHIRVGAAAIAVPDSGESARLTRQRSKGWDLSTEPNWSVATDSTWAQWLRDTRRPVSVDELAGCAADAGAQVEALRQTGCVVVAPTVRHGQLRGVLYLSAKVDREVYSAADFAFLDLLIEQFSVSLENAYLYAREQRANEQLLITRQRLAVAEKLAALGQMAATIAHEVRNPAGIIRNYLSLIRPALSDHKAETGYLDVINQELGRIELFVQSLLGAFHPNRCQPLPVSLSTQVDAVLGFVRPRLEQRQIAVTSQIDAALPPVSAEPEALRQVLLNLILNAIDAMPEGGILSFTANADLDFVHMSIADTGPGISDDVLERLFDPFVTTKPEGEGSGLGLSICRSLLERFDAQIGARNLATPSHGAVFTIHLRRADSTGQRRIPAGSATARGRDTV